MAIFSLSVTFRVPGIGMSAVSFISKNTTKCIETPDFLNIERRVLESLVSRPELNVVESVLLQRVIDWAMEQCKRKEMDSSPENLRTVLGRVFRRIHFMSIPDKDFDENMLLQQILTEEEISELQRLYDKSNRNEDLTSDIFETTPRKGGVFSVLRCNISEDSVNSVLNVYPRIPRNALCLEVSGPLWLYGVTVFRCRSDEQYIAVSLTVKADDKDLRTVEQVTFCDTESISNTMNIYLRHPLRLVPSTKYALHLVLFCSAEDRVIYGALNADDTLEYCDETITFSVCREGLFTLSSASFAGLLLQGMKGDRNN